MVPQQIFLMGQNHFLFRRVFTYGSPSRLFSSEIILKSFCSERTLMRHTSRISEFLSLESSSTPQNILQCTAIWECILVLKLHRRSLFWFLTVSNNHCSETLVWYFQSGGLWMVQNLFALGISWIPLFPLLNTGWVHYPQTTHGYIFSSTQNKHFQDFGNWVL